MKKRVLIKGSSDGLNVQILEKGWEEALFELLQSIDAQPDFFKGARLRLSLGEIHIGVIELSSLRDMLSDRGVQLWSVISDHQATASAAADLGLSIAHPGVTFDPADVVTSEFHGDEAILLHRTMRSGQSIHHSGHIIIVGDVNPGAVISAGGNILVWGRLRGTVHAGSDGNENAIICALDMSPTQLRIATQIAISPTVRGSSQPEVARIHEGQLVAEAWSPDRRI